MNISRIMRDAEKQKLIIPAYNVPYLPMMEPILSAAMDEDAFILIQAAMVDWTKFQAISPGEVARLFMENRGERCAALHLDHIPVIDEDQKEVNYEGVIRQALDCGFNSIMLDGSRLSLDDNIRATKAMAVLTHSAGAPLEAELGMVRGHEAGPLPPYEEMFVSKEGFTRVEDAKRFVEESECDWLSVAIGNVHGALSDGLAAQQKQKARLDIGHLHSIHEAIGIPVVLHGGSGIPGKYIQAGIKEGISKINIGTEIRLAYALTLKETNNVSTAQEAVYQTVRHSISELLGMTGSRTKLFDKTDKTVA